MTRVSIQRPEWTGVWCGQRQGRCCRRLKGTRACVRRWVNPPASCQDPDSIDGLCTLALPALDV